MMQDCFCRFAELGCRSVGLMIPSRLATSAVLAHIDDLTNSLEIKLNYEWVVVINSADEATGYSRFCALWDLRKRPEGLLVFPDIKARGVVSAIAELRVRVPQDLKLILHRNAETPYKVPVPCDWIEVSVAPLATALFRSLEKQWKGEGADPELIPFQFVKNGEIGAM